MKQALLTGLALAAGVQFAQAQVLASDDFSYVGPLTTNGWFAHSGAGNKMIMSDGLVATLDHSSGSGEDVSLVFPPQAATDTTYASFTLNVPSGNPVNPDASGTYFFHLKDAAFAFRARTGVVAPATTGDFGLAINADISNLGAGAIWATDLSFDTNYNVVVSWSALTGTSQLWLDPADMNSTSLTHVGLATGELMEAIALRQSNDHTGFVKIDNVVVGKTFADVTSVVPSGPGTAYCFGDGTGSACPCGNNNDGSNGNAGCANGSNAGGASLDGAGTASISNDTVVLTATGVQPSQPGLFFRADNAVNGGLGNVFGDGLRCAGGAIVRLGVVISDGSGVSTSNPGVGSGLAAGDIKRYQYWYRNPAGSPCGSAFNLSNGYEITWGL
jgi:hypothetical protein